MFFSLKGVLEVETAFHQQASVPIGGSYTLTFGHNVTVPLEYDASPTEVSFEFHD